jgi:hypothetical protein
MTPPSRTFWITRGKLDHELQIESGTSLAEPVFHVKDSQSLKRR